MSPEAAAENAASVFAELGGTQVDPPSLMPALFPLELSGEAVRARLCIFSDAGGQEQALRPDLTLPVALAEAELRAAGERGETLRRYNARAFRLPSVPGEPMEFTQIGFERFGAEVSYKTDAEVFGEVHRAALASGAEIASAWFGDLAVFPAFVDALSLAPGLADALKRAFRQQGGVRALLSGEAGGGTARGNRLAAQLRGASRGEAEAMVSDMLDLSGVTLVGERTVGEIADRLMAKAAEAEAGGVPDDAAGLLRGVLAVEAGPVEAVETLARLASERGVEGAVGDTLDILAQRMEAILADAPELAEVARFGTPFGRRFNYYDGFLFELFGPGGAPSRPFGAGGRYDGLIGRLSQGRVEVSAVGGVVRPDRLAQAAGGAI